MPSKEYTIETRLKIDITHLIERGLYRCCEHRRSAVKLSFQAYNNTICVGFIHKSRTANCVGTCAQMKMCVVLCTCMLLSEQSSDGLCETSISMIEGMVIYLRALIGDVSDVFLKMFIMYVMTVVV